MDNSESSAVFEVMNSSATKTPSPRKRKQGQFTIKEGGSTAQKKKRAIGRMKGIHHRRRTSIFKELAHLQADTDWEGFVVLRSKDKTKLVVGGTDEELKEKFLNKEPLVNNIKDIPKRNLHIVDMSSVMMKLSSIGKRVEKVTETPDPSPSKVPDVALGMLPSKRQKQALENI